MRQNYLRFPKTDLLPREVNNADVRSIFLPNHTLRFSSPSSPKLCLRKRSFDIRLLQQWMRMRQVYSIIFLLVGFYFLGHVFSKCKRSISFFKSLVSTLCSTCSATNLTSFPFTSGSKAFGLPFYAIPYERRK